MSINDVIEKFESEKAEIARKLEELQSRTQLIDELLAEIRKVKPKGKRGAASKPKSKKRGRKKGGMTVKDAILKVVAGADAPLTPGEIIPKASSLSGGAVPSIRTQINTLAKGGALEQVEHAGRGYKYTIASSAAATPAKKPRTKKKRSTRKKAASKPAAVTPAAS